MDTTNKTYLLKLNLITWITAIQDVETLSFLEQLQQQQIESGWWNDISEYERQSIEKGLLEAENGNTIPHFEVKKLYEKWLN